jgi:hypothetical protein
MISILPEHAPPSSVYKLIVGGHTAGEIPKLQADIMIEAYAEEIILDVKDLAGVGIITATSLFTALELIQITDNYGSVSDHYTTMLHTLVRHKYQLYIDEIHW